MALKIVEAHVGEGLGAEAQDVIQRDGMRLARLFFQRRRHVTDQAQPVLEAFDAEPTYVVCRSGARSGRACEFLRDQGRTAVNVTGGMIAWTAAGFEVVTGAGSGAPGA